MTDKVAVAYMQTAEHPAVFTESMLQLFDWDRAHHNRIVGRIPAFGASGRLPETRNSLTTNFLDQTPADWLFMIDDDMGFAPWTVDQLVDTCVAHDVKVMGGLCFAQRVDHFDTNLHVPISVQYPTMYMWEPESGSFLNISDYPDEGLVRVAGTGAACMLVHRSVFEAMRAEHGDNWFSQITTAHGTFSEDLSFCMRCDKAGVHVYVNTACRTAHTKPSYLTHETYQAQRGTFGRRERWVVIPTKNKLDLLESLVHQLREQGEADGIVVVDNGSGRTTRNWLSTQPDLTVIDMPDAGIHAMWNAGIDACPPNADIAVLNNDLMIGPNFLTGLQDALVKDPSLAVVCPNYDERPGVGVELTTDICANRYDHTGGLAGFAFMVSADFSYRFPEECMWWYGDNDMVLTAVQSGRSVGIVLGTSVVHIDGGGQTGRWDDPELAEVLKADRDAFCARWGIPVAA